MLECLQILTRLALKVLKIHDTNEFQRPGNRIDRSAVRKKGEGRGSKEQMV
jgi:hypothetical protein